MVDLQKRSVNKTLSLWKSLATGKGIKVGRVGLTRKEGKKGRGRAGWHQSTWDAECAAVAPTTATMSIRAAPASPTCHPCRCDEPNGQPLRPSLGWRTGWSANGCRFPCPPQQRKLGGSIGRPISPARPGDDPGRSGNRFPATTIRVIRATGPGVPSRSTGVSPGKLTGETPVLRENPGADAPGSPGTSNRVPFFLPHSLY